LLDEGAEEIVHPQAANSVQIRVRIPNHSVRLFMLVLISVFAPSRSSGSAGADQSGNGSLGLFMSSVNVYMI
jgi:hypothetical protein